MDQDLIDDALCLLDGLIARNYLLDLAEGIPGHYAKPEQGLAMAVELATMVRCCSEEPLNELKFILEKLKSCSGENSSSPPRVLKAV